MSVISVGPLPRTAPATGLPQVQTIAFTAVTAAVTAGALAGLPMPPAATALILAASVVVVGLPHGGLDHRVGRALLFPQFAAYWSLPFLAAYLSVGASILVGWSFAPLTTIALFLTLSAVHFGDTECGPRWRAALFGGLPIWLPLLARPGETATLLGWVTPGGIDLAESLAASRPLLIVIATVAAVTWVVGTVSSACRGDRDGLLDAVRLAASAGMLVFAPVLVAFAVCFCGWHSVRELGRLAVQADRLDPASGFRRVALAAAPLALVAAVLAAGGAWYFGSGRELGPVVVQAVFLGLSAVAVPHILLHVVAARYGADPFTDDREVTGEI